MIFVCEPLCRGFSHEKVNSGFLRGLRLAFPDQRIRVYAEATHIQSLKDILAYDNILIEDIEYVPIWFGDELSIRGFWGYHALLGQVFTEVLSARESKVFFLSFSSVLLFIIKRLKKRPRFSTIKFALVLHGQYEEISGQEADASSAPIPTPALANRLRKFRITQIPNLALREVANKAKSLWKAWQKKLLLGLLPLRKIMIWRHSDDFRYVALAPHVVENSKRYMDVEAMNMHVVPMPIAFAAPLPMPNNPYPKFAVFGFGNAAMLHQVLLRLSQVVPSGAPYEIRIVGMDNRGISGFPNVTAPSNGRPMGRREMEAQARDIDAFLILYTKESYRVSCSGSIFEAFSYLKPVLHFENESVDAFNRTTHPIGLRAKSVDEFVANMAEIICNYPSFRDKAKGFRENILRLRSEFSIERWAPQLRHSFLWPSDVQ